nr:immunoglobulin light chain junction region [Homo sapiens]
DFAVYYCQQYG